MTFNTALQKGVASLVLALGAVASAHAIPAFTLSGTGPVEIKYTGVTAASTAGGAGKFGSGLESTFGAGYLNSINKAGDPATVFWQQGISNTVSFILYGIADDSFKNNGANFNLFNSGCTIGPLCDGKIHLNFYLDNTTANGGTNPGFTGPTGVKAGDRVSNTLPGITDGTLLMGWEFIPGIVIGDSTTTLYQNVSSLTLPAKGDGNFLASCTSGPACSMFDTNTQLNGADFVAQFTLLEALPGTQTALNGWGGRVSDPVNAFVKSAGEPLPEPTAPLLLSIGLLGLMAVSRRKNS